MRILYLNDYLGRTDLWTGERGRQLTRELRRAGAVVEILPAIPAAFDEVTKSKAGPGSRIKAFVKSRLSVARLMVLLEVYFILRGAFRTAKWGWYIWRRRGVLNPDVILARTFEYEWAPLVAARILNRPLVLEVHTPFYIERTFRNRSDSRLFRWLEAALWRRATAIWVHTSELKRIVVSNGVDERRVAKIPFGIETGGAQPASSADAGPIRVVFVGSFYPWHGMDVLLNAFAAARKTTADLRLTMIGDGIMRAESETIARELGIDDAVEFTGWVSQEIMRTLLAEAHIGVAPYQNLKWFYFEPVKVLDYMAAGLAIVASANGTVSDLLDAGKAGILVPPEDPTALAAALVRLASDPQLRHDLAKEAHARTPSWQSTAGAVLALCGEAVDAVSQHKKLQTIAKRPI